MKTKVKRLSALFMAFAMSVSVMQATAFAEATHSSELAWGPVTINQDGTYDILETCAEHAKDASATCAKHHAGRIATKVENGATVVDPSKSQPQDWSTTFPTLAFGVNVVAANCVTPATITYTVTIDEKAYRSDAFKTADATGVHKFANANIADADLTTEQLENPEHYKVIADTATCQAAGEKTYAKICQDCHQTITTATVVRPSAMTDHQWIQDETTSKDKVFNQEITPATCQVAGKEYHYIQCKDCGQKLYANAEDEFVATSLYQAKQYGIAQFVHNYVYTATCEYDYVTDKTLPSITADDFTITGKCSTCPDQTNAAKASVQSVQDVQIDSAKTKIVKPVSACQPGSVTYTLKYTAKVAENGTLKDTPATIEVTVPYYLKGAYPDQDNHTWSTPAPDDDSVVEATCTAAGKYNLVKTCTVCGEKEVVATIKISKIAHKAAAAVKENVVKATYAKGGSYDLVTRCADCGKAISTTHKTTAKLTVNAPVLSSVKNVKGKKATVAWKKASSVSGYQVQYATSSSFKSAKSVKTTASSKTISKLSKNKKYYVRVRSYKVSGGKTYYSSWSKVKTVTIKK